MRYSAGQLPDGFDLLGLTKGLLDAGALFHFGPQMLVGLLEGTGALDHELLELLGRPLARLQQGPNFILPPAGPHCGLNCARQRDRLNRAFKQRNVAKCLDDAAAPGNHRRLLPVAGENDKGQVGPGRLPLDPMCQRLGILPEQTLLGEKDRAHARRHLADQFRQTPTIDRCEIRTTEKLDRCRSIAADRSKHENAMIAVGVHSDSPSGISVPE
ncbi:hypothetical protein BcanWSM471_17055 [Bradyrhizobium sp. WSM471]|nr:MULTISPECIES: hypothetical protein [Bradyrhizobium]UFW45167.1 hypothetical protein BcanWSM471_17055 [Bradyrhizobium canariense]